MRVKVFCKVIANDEHSGDEFEERINTWLSENDGNIVITDKLLTSTSTNSIPVVTITIFYDLVVNK